MHYKRKRYRTFSFVWPWQVVSFRSWMFHECLAIGFTRILGIEEQINWRLTREL